MVDSAYARAVTFGLTYGGHAYVVEMLEDHWPEVTLITADLISQRQIRRDGDRIFISVANGDAEYRIVREDTSARTFLLELVRGFLEPPKHHKAHAV